VCCTKRGNGGQHLVKVVGGGVGGVTDVVGASADTVAALTDMGVEDPDQLGEDKGVPMMMEPASEKRIRREIANSNERRRMQSINAGFSSLRSYCHITREKN